MIVRMHARVLGILIKNEGTTHYVKNSYIIIENRCIIHTYPGRCSFQAIDARWWYLVEIVKRKEYRNITNHLILMHKPTSGYGRCHIDWQPGSHQRRTSRNSERFTGLPANKDRTLCRFVVWKANFHVAPATLK